ncbi:uncharacterized protein LOC114515792 [Dendronephthya gigantea]|uniref:uncharacterized protein LOC114515792 n=1 Tax=Dendronephthya gigantea TaxID=151771 RepID=UPI00106AAD24|nr:uncharacterized protein LOC114515792 [Dendronephthya gigantea]
MIHSKSNRFMQWCVLLSLLSLMSAYCSVGATRNRQDFNRQNEMRFFDRSTKQIIYWLQKDPPDEIFKEVIGNWNNNTVNVKSKIVLYEWPFIAFSGFLFLSVLTTSITGFVILFYKKIIKAKPDKNSLETSIVASCTSGNRGYVFLLAFLSCFLIITDLCLLISNNHLSEGLPHARRTLINSIDSLQDFQNNTIQELDHILRDNFDSTISRSLNRFRVLADCSPGGLDSLLKKKRVNFVKVSERASSDLQQTRVILSHINMTLGELYRLSSGLRSELGKMNLYFKEAKRLCSSSMKIISGDVCKKFAREKDDLLPGSSLQASRNLSETTSRLDKFLKHLNYSSVKKVLETQEDVERQLCEGRSAKLRELEKLCDGIQMARGFTLDVVKKYSNQLAEKSLIPMKNEVDMTLADDGNIGRYEHKRWWISFLIIQVMLMASLSIFGSLVLNLVGPYVSRLPFNTYYMMETKKWLLWLPKRLLLSSTVVQLSMAIVVNLCAGVAFLVVSNLALVCEMSSHYERLDNILDTSKFLQESKLFTKEQKSLKLFKKISECPEDGTLWVMLNLDEKFNINNSVNKLNEIPRIADRVFGDGGVLLDKGRQKHLQDFDRILREWRNIGLGKVNIDALAEQVNNPILDKSFRKLSKSLLSSYQPHSGKKKENVTRTPFKMSRNLSNNAHVIEENYIKLYSVLSKLLNRHLESFNKSREKAFESFNIMSDLYSNIASDTLERTAHEIVDRQAVHTVEVIKKFIKDSVNKVRSNVGKCSPVKHAYNQTVCLFCRDLFGTWNSWWILSMLCGFLTILSIILCFLLLERIN